MKGSNYTAHINSPSRIHMVYSKHNTLHCSAMQKPCPQGPWAFFPQLMRRKKHKNPNRSLAIHRSKNISSYLYSIFTDVRYSATSPSFHQFTGSGLQMGEKTLWRLCHSPGHCKCPLTQMWSPPEDTPVSIWPHGTAPPPHYKRWNDTYRPMRR